MAPLVCSVTLQRSLTANLASWFNSPALLPSYPCATHHAGHAVVRPQEDNFKAVSFDNEIDVTCMHIDMKYFVMATQWSLRGPTHRLHHPLTLHPNHEAELGECYLCQGLRFVIFSDCRSSRQTHNDHHARHKHQMVWGPTTWTGAPEPFQTRNARTWPEVLGKGRIFARGVRAFCIRHTMLPPPPPCGYAVLLRVFCKCLQHCFCIWDEESCSMSEINHKCRTVRVCHFLHNPQKKTKR
jgi:hypothetical protein